VAQRRCNGRRGSTIHQDQVKISCTIQGEALSENSYEVK
jgi:hypothetical protein